MWDFCFFALGLNCDSCHKYVVCSPSHVCVCSLLCVSSPLVHVSLLVFHPRLPVSLSHMCVLPYLSLALSVLPLCLTAN